MCILHGLVQELDDSCLSIFWVNPRDFSEGRKMMHCSGASE